MALAKALVSAGAGLPDQRHGVRLGRESRQASDRVPGEAPGGPRVPLGRDRRHRRRARARRHPGGTRREGVARGRDNVAELIRGGRVDLVINTPFGRGPRRDGYFIRTASGDGGRAVHHDAARGVRGRARHRGAPRRSQRAAVAPGTSRGGGGGAVAGAALVRGGDGLRRGRGRREAGPGRDPVDARASARTTRSRSSRPRSRSGRGPGQFLAIAMPEGREFLLRRHFAIHQASRRGGWAGTLEFVVDPSGPGTAWLGSARAHEFLDVIGPLGKPLRVPEAADQLPAGGGGARRGFALLPGAGADRARTSGSTWSWAASPWSGSSSRSRPSGCRRRSRS